MTEMKGLFDNVGKIIRKGSSFRIVSGINTNGGHVEICLSRPSCTEICGRPIYPETTFEKLRYDLARWKEGD